MSTSKRIVINGLLAGITLAIIGMMYAQLASMWVSSQPSRRTGLDETLARTNSVRLPDELNWRLPLTMGVMGFCLVALGESLFSLWRQPAKPPIRKPSLEEETDALLQKLLDEAGHNPSHTPPPMKSLSQSNSE